MLHSNIQELLYLGSFAPQHMCIGPLLYLMQFVHFLHVIAVAPLCCTWHGWRVEGTCCVPCNPYKMGSAPHWPILFFPINCCNHYQERIQDFPLGRANPCWRGRQPPTQALFGENICKNERIWSILLYVDPPLIMYIPTTYTSK